MNRERIFGLAGTTLLAGGLFAGSIAWAAAQEHPHGSMHGTAVHGPGHAQQRDHDDQEHTRMLAAVAEALGLTVEDLQAALEAGKTMPQIAEEQGVDLADLHETVMAQHE
jgi:hypothetical protein